MSLSDRIFANSRDLSASIEIGGVLLQPADPTSSAGIPGWSMLELFKSLDSPVPTLSILVNRIPNWVERGMAVTVELGYDGYTQRVFTGYVQDRSRDVIRPVIHCMGKLSSAFQTVEVPERDVDGLTVEAACEAILDYVGINDRVIDVPSFTLGTASDPVLEKMMISQQLQTLMDVDGCRIWEIGPGVVYIKQVDELPSPDAFRTYTTNVEATARILHGSDEEDPEYLRTRVIVNGAQVVEGTPPNETTRVITATAYLTECDLVQPPLPDGTYRDCEFNNHLIDTDAKAVDIAARLMTKYARVPRSLTLELAGDPQIEVGMTVELDFPELDAVNNWFVWGVSHIVMNEGYKTQLQLRGGDQYGGTIKLAPIAAFTYKIDRQVLTDAVYVIATFDASGSYDPDGSIASYAWSDNKSTTPEINTLTDPIVTVRVPAASVLSDWEVTLTVTDNDGLSSSVTITCNTEVGEENVTLPVLYSALNNNASASSNGGQTWNDQSGSTCVSVAAKPYDGATVGVALFGYTDGSIKRTADFCRSSLDTVLAAAAANGTITHIKWDMNQPTRVWAVTTTGRVLVSHDDGANFEVYKDFGNTYPLNRLLNPYMKGIIVFGGRGDISSTLIQWDLALDGNWQSAAIGGELATDLVGSGSSVTIADASSMLPNELVIVFKGAALGGGSAVAVYSTDELYGGGSAWKRATGLTAGLIHGRFCTSDPLSAEYHVAFDDRNVWHSADKVAFSKTDNVFPANGKPWHAVWTGEHGINQLSGVYIASLEDTSASGFGIYKTTDGFRTALALRPATGYPAWPSNAIGKMTVLGTGEYAPADVLGLFQEDQTANTKVAKLQDGTWTLQSTISGTFYNKLFKFGDYHWALSPGGQAKRSSDQGQNWTDKLNYCWAMCRAVDGRLWAATRNTDTFPTYYIQYSDNDGDNWTISKTLAPELDIYPHHIFNMSAHPSNPNVILCYGYRSTQENIWYTLDRGSNWTNIYVNWGLGNVDYHYKDCEVTQTGRFVFTTYLIGAPADVVIRVSDSPYSTTRQVYIDTPAAEQVTLLRAGFNIFHLQQSDSLRRSSNNAEAWDELTATGLGSITMPLYYHSLSKKLFVAKASDTFTSASLIKEKKKPETDEFSWVDVSLNLATAIGASTYYRCGTRGLAEL